MKKMFLVLLSLVAVVVLGTMGNGLLRAYATAAEPCSSTASMPTIMPIATATVPRTVNVAVDGCITIWSDALGFNSPKVQPLHTSAKLVQNPVQGIWTITIANLSIRWSSKTILTLQDGQVASGVFYPSTNSVSLIVPLKGVPLINTITFSLSTESSVTTTDKQTIRGSRVDLKGDTTLVGSKSHIGIFDNQAQISIQCKLSPWPLPTSTHARGSF
jgi:hypothetical protein